MTRLRVNCFGVSIDGYGAGPNQALDHPLGVGGTKLHQWQFETRTFRNVAGGEGDGTAIDDRFVARGFDGVGAWILGPNMFGPIRGDRGRTNHDAAGGVMSRPTARPLHLALAPVLLGTGEPLLADLDLPALGYECMEFVPGENATHFVLAKRA